MVKTISDLAVLSNQLNEKSNELNRIIERFNEKLGALNLGIESWLTGRPLHQDEFRDTSTATVGASSARVTLLGYCRVGEEWQLAFKTAMLNEYFEDGVEWTEITQSSSPLPLLKASRGLRIKAMGNLESLLVQIQTEASRLLAGIEAAENAAAKL